MLGDSGFADPARRLPGGMPDGQELAGPGGTLDRVTRDRDVLGSRLDGDHAQLLGVLASRVHLDDALALEKIGDRVGLAEVPAVLGEEVTEGGAGSVPVVGDAVDQDRHAGGTVAPVAGVLRRLPGGRPGAPG